MTGWTDAPVPLYDLGARVRCPDGPEGTVTWCGDVPEERVDLARVNRPEECVEVEYVITLDDGSKRILSEGQLTPA